MDRRSVIASGRRMLDRHLRECRQEAPTSHTGRHVHDPRSREREADPVWGPTTPLEPASMAVHPKAKEKAATRLHRHALSATDAGADETSQSARPTRRWRGDDASLSATGSKTAATRRDDPRLGEAARAVLDDYAPERVAAIRRIPAETIENLANRYGTTRRLHPLNYGLQRHAGGGSRCVRYRPARGQRRWDESAAADALDLRDVLEARLRGAGAD